MTSLASGSWWSRFETATPCWASSMRAGAPYRVASRTSSLCRSSTCTNPCTRPSSVPEASRSSFKSGPGTCTGQRNSVSPLTGATSSATWAANRGRMISAGCASSWSGSGRPRIPTSSWIRSATTCPLQRYSSSRPRATWLRFPREVRRSISPTASTRRWVIGAWGPESTASSSHWSLSSPTETSSRSSRPRQTGQDPAVTGSPSSSHRGRSRRSRHGSARSVARRQSSRARTPSCARCARRASRSSDS